MGMGEIDIADNGYMYYGGRRVLSVTQLGNGKGPFDDFAAGISWWNLGGKLGWSFVADLFPGSDPGFLITFDPSDKYDVPVFNPYYGRDSVIVMSPGPSTVKLLKQAAAITGVYQGVRVLSAMGATKGLFELAEANITNSGKTVLGSYPGYTTEAKALGASYFDIGPAWEGLTPAPTMGGKQTFPGRDYLKGRRGDSFDCEVKYLTQEREPIERNRIPYQRQGIPLDQRIHIGETMNKLLQFIVGYFSFLYDDLGADLSILKSAAWGTAPLILEIGDLRLRFVNDRGDILLDFQHAGHTPDEKWFSVRHRKAVCYRDDRRQP